VADLLSAGADDCVTKPFAAAELRARLGALARRGRTLPGSERTFAGLEYAFEADDRALAIVSASGRVLRANAALRALLGRRRDELLAGHAGDLLRPRDRIDEADRRSLVLHGMLPVERRERDLAHGDGSWIRARVTVTRADDGAGRARSVLWLVEPIAAPTVAPR
jgi:PAS domain S-box-containing protein